MTNQEKFRELMGIDAKIAERLGIEVKDPTRWVFNDPMSRRVIQKLCDRIDELTARIESLERWHKNRDA